jgi:photosystem II stability/assembly factor-like uncharacterized protein
MKFMKSVLLSVLMLFLNADVDASWQKLSYGILEAPVFSLALHPTQTGHIYAGTKGSLYRSKNRGEAWDRILKLGAASSIVRFIYLDPNFPNLIFVGSDEGLHRSINGGRSWEKIFSRFEELESKVLSIGFDSQKPSLMLVGTGNGLFLSEDGGLTWRKEPVLQEHPVYEIESSSDDQYAYLIANENGLYALSRGNQSWRRLFQGNPEYESTGDSDNAEIDPESELFSSSARMSFFIDESQRIFLYYKRNLLVSEDMGNSWSSKGQTTLSQISAGLDTYDAESKQLFVPTRQGIYFLNTQTANVESLNVGLVNRSIHDVSYDSKNDILYVATEMGLFTLKHPRTALYFDSIQREQQLNTKDVLDYFDHEPTIQTLHEVAMRYAEVHPEKIEQWRAQAKLSPLLPSVSIGYDESSGETVELDRGGTNDPDRFILGPDENDQGVSVDFSWHFSEMIWNPQQTSIDNRSKLMVQLRDDLLNQLNHLYYSRRRVQIDLLMGSNHDVFALMEKQLLIDEYTAGIDALTGGYFSQLISPRLRDHYQQEAAG